MAQIVFQIQPRKAVAMHARVEHDVLTLAVRFGPIYRDVSVAEDSFNVVAIWMAQRHADAGGDHHFTSIEGERAAELSSDVVGHRGRLCLAGDAVEQHHELIAAKAGDGVLGPSAGQQSGGRLHQQLVADGVAEAVVDQLETVQVDEQQCDDAPMPGGADEGLLEAVI